MSEGAIGGDRPRRGRKDPELVARLLAEQMQEEQQSEQEEQHLPAEEAEGGFGFFRTGRTITAGLSAALPVYGLQDNPWSTFKVTETFDEDQDLEEIIAGMAEVCTAGTIAVSAALERQLEEARIEREAAPIKPRPITPRPRA